MGMEAFFRRNRFLLKVVKVVVTLALIYSVMHVCFHISNKPNLDSGLPVKLPRKIGEKSTTAEILDVNDKNENADEEELDVQNSPYVDDTNNNEDNDNVYEGNNDEINKNENDLREPLRQGPGSNSDSRVIKMHRHLNIQYKTRESEILHKTQYKGIWPHKNIYKDTDRINSALINYVPPKYDENTAVEKTILLYGGKKVWYVKEGPGYFDTCRVKSCTLTYNTSLVREADAVIFVNPFAFPRRLPPKGNSQLWGIYMLESPPHTRSMKRLHNLVNYTMTYRMDSLIPTPYFYYNTSVTSFMQPAPQNHAAGKTKTAAWFASNCFNVNSGRKQLVDKLRQYIQVDTFGMCGERKCTRAENPKCMKMLNDNYKFYIVFENSKCRDYLTEKILKALLYNMIPVIMGPSREFCHATLPRNSYIHFEDFTSVKQMAEHIIKLDKDDELFNQYFAWKKTPWELSPIHEMCTLCSLMHDEDFPNVWYDDVDEWWRGSVCINKNKNWS